MSPSSSSVTVKRCQQSAVEVGEADEVNSFPVLASAKLPAGEYMARVTVEQGGRTTQQSAPVSVRP